MYLKSRIRLFGSKKINSTKTARFPTGDRVQASRMLGTRMAADLVRTLSAALSHAMWRAPRVGAYIPSELRAHAHHDDMRRVPMHAGMLGHCGSRCLLWLRLSMECLGSGGHVARGGAVANHETAVFGQKPEDRLLHRQQLDAFRPAPSSPGALRHRLHSSRSHSLDRASRMYLCGSWEPPSRELHDDMRFCRWRCLVGYLWWRRSRAKNRSGAFKDAIVLAKGSSVYQERRTSVLLVVR